MDAQRRICELLGLGFSALWHCSRAPLGGFAPLKLVHNSIPARGQNGASSWEP
jgi:hypothetical protein